MIVFDLICGGQHRFEGWFRSTNDFVQQQASGMLGCPQCASTDVAKAPMAPAVPVKTNRVGAVRKGGKAAMPEVFKGAEESMASPVPAEVAAAFIKLAAAQIKALSNSKWVGSDFAERSRAIHYGEAADERIHGRASREEAVALIEEGIVIAPLLVPVVPPEEAN